MMRLISLQDEEDITVYAVSQVRMQGEGGCLHATKWALTRLWI